MVGHWHLPETPSLNLVHDVPGLVQVYLVALADGELYMHSNVEAPCTPSNMKKLESIFIEICLGLYERGMEEVKTFVDPTDENQVRYCEFYGFELSGKVMIFTTPAGEELVRAEMVYKLPLDEDD